MNCYKEIDMQIYEKHFYFIKDAPKQQVDITKDRDAFSKTLTNLAQNYKINNTKINYKDYIDKQSKNLEVDSIGQKTKSTVKTAMKSIFRPDNK